MSGGAAIVALLVLVIVAWNVAEAGRIARRSTLPFLFRLVTGLVGFLVVPAWLLEIGGASVITGRALGSLGWFWTLILLLALVQALASWLLGLVSAWVAAPLVAFNAILLLAGAARYAAAMGHAPPLLFLVPGHALAQLFALAVGPGAFASPAAVLMPLMAPARAAAAALGRASRAGLIVLATTLVAALAWRSLPAWRALRGYDGLGLERATELITARARGDLRIGLEVLPLLSAAPSAALLRDDLALAESLAVHTLAVRVRLDRVNNATLDSLDRALEPMRRDSIALTVTFALAGPARSQDAAAARTDARVAADVERTVRRLRPERLVMELPASPRGGTLDQAGLALWTERLEWLAGAARDARPSTRILLQTGVISPRDSALRAWASGTAGTLAGVVTPVGPDSRGAAGILATLATLERWSETTSPAREQWIVVSGAPVLEGDDAQRRLVRHVLVWAASRAFVRGIVLADANDYDRMTGLRSAQGRLRAAVAEAAATVHVLSDSTPPSP